MGSLFKIWFGEWMNECKQMKTARQKTERESKRKKIQVFRNKTNQIKMLSQVKPNRYKRIHTAHTFVSIAMIAIKKSRYSLENAQQSPNKNRKSSSKSKSDEKKAHHDVTSCIWNDYKNKTLTKYLLKRGLMVLSVWQQKWTFFCMDSNLKQYTAYKRAFICDEEQTMNEQDSEAFFAVACCYHVRWSRYALIETLRCNRRNEIKNHSLAKVVCECKNIHRHLMTQFGVDKISHKTPAKILNIYSADLVGF